MINDQEFSATNWLQSLAINCLLLLLYGLTVFFLVRWLSDDRPGTVAALLMIGSAIAFVFNILANFLFFLRVKVSPEVVLGVQLSVTCLLFFGGGITLCFFWGAALVNYLILKVYFARGNKK